jgi:ABC-type spermidine/putrescine transport system permease subunit II
VLVRSAALGAFIALLVSGLLHIVIIGLAKGATPGGQVPAQMGLRLTYAWYTLSTAVTRLADQVIGALGYAPLIALAGAALGVLAYLAPTRLTRRRRGGRMRRRRS